MFSASPVRSGIAFLLLTLFSLPSTFADALRDPSIDRFQQVSDGLYRGARPGTRGVRQLASLRFKTILNLEDEPDAVRAESAESRSVGIRMVSSPMRVQDRPNDEQVNQLLRAMQTPALMPIFIHCKHGQDRTGMMIGLYRVLVQHWTPAQAYQEMLSIGFHPEYRTLDQYFRARTGYSGL